MLEEDGKKDPVENVGKIYSEAENVYSRVDKPQHGILPLEGDTQ